MVYAYIFAQASWQPSTADKKLLVGGVIGGIFSTIVLVNLTQQHRKWFSKKRSGQQPLSMFSSVSLRNDTEILIPFFSSETSTLRGRFINRSANYGLFVICFTNRYGQFSQVTKKEHANKYRCTLPNYHCARENPIFLHYCRSMMVVV